MLKLLRYLLVPTALFTFALGKLYISWNMILLGVMAFWLVNVFYCFENIKQRIYFFIFNITLFVFLLSRPVISFFRGEIWWCFEAENVNFALNGLMLALVFMLVGYSICEQIIKDKEKLRKNSLIRKKAIEAPKYFEKFADSSFIFNLRVISLIAFFVSISFLLVAEMEKFTFMRYRSYLELYTSFKSQLPYIIPAIGATSKYFLCIFLATFPSKRWAFIPLALYVISAVPVLCIGNRNPIVLNLIFAFLYYFTRDIMDGLNYGNKETSLKEKDFSKKLTRTGKINKAKRKLQNKWIGKKEWACVILLTPICIMFLGIYNYIRDGKQAESLKVLDVITDFFYKQGVSFDFLCICY